jgi:tRNA (guanine37-N1)-methyltransferase
VLGNPDSLTEESFNQQYTEYPQYTRPEKYKGWKVPEVLLSGNHKKIKIWRNKKD